MMEEKKQFARTSGLFGKAGGGRFVFGLKQFPGQRPGGAVILQPIEKGRPIRWGKLPRQETRGRGQKSQ